MSRASTDDVHVEHDDILDHRPAQPRRPLSVGGLQQQMKYMARSKTGSFVSKQLATHGKDKLCSRTWPSRPQSRRARCTELTRPPGSSP